MATQTVFFDPLDAVVANGATKSSAGISHPGSEKYGSTGINGNNHPLLNNATAVQVDSSGSLYIACQTGSYVRKVNAALDTQLAEYGAITTPTDIHLDEAAGEVFVVSFGTDSVVVLDTADLTYKRDFPVMNQPDCITMLPNGNVLVGGDYNATSAINEYTPAGVFVALRMTAFIPTTSPIRISVHPSNGQLLVHRRASFAGVDRRRSMGWYDYLTGITNHGAPFVADANTVGLYHCEEASGDLLDSSGNGYDGVPTGIVYQSAGAFGYGFETNSDNDRVSLNAAVPGMSSALGSFEFDFQATTPAQWTDSSSRFFCSVFTDGNNYILVSKNGVNKNLQFIYMAGGTQVVIALASTAFADAEKHKFGMTWDTGADEIKAYVDGVLVGTATGLGTWVGAIASITVGNRWAVDFSMYGIWDEVRLSDSVRTQEFDWVQDFSPGIFRTTLGNWDDPMPWANNDVSHHWDNGWGDFFWDAVNGEWLVWTQELVLNGVYRVDAAGNFTDRILRYLPEAIAENMQETPGSSRIKVFADANYIYLAAGYASHVRRWDRRTGEGVHSITLPAGATLNQIIATGYEPNKHRVSYRLGGAGGWTVIDPIDLTPLAVATSGQLLEVKAEQNVLYGATGTAPLDSTPVPLKLGLAYEDGITLPGISAQGNLTLESGEGSLMLDNDDATLLED